MHLKSGSTQSLLELTVLATAVAGLLYFVYFQLAPWIWSQGMPLNPVEITPWSLPWVNERDGIELYALYVLMFLNLFFIYILSYGWSLLASKPVRYLLALPLVAVAGAFIGSIGFHPPMSTLADHPVPDIITQSLTVMAVILPIIILLYYLQMRSTYRVLAIAALLLIPVCFITTTPLSWFNYQFILAPALRLLHGANVSETYFQYDLLLSLIGLAWMKLRLDLNLFQVVAQCSIYLLLLGLFAFSRRWFLDKRLPIFLLVALVLVRIYGGSYDAIFFFQATPLRLDMWLILLLLVFFKGPYHWSAGLFCGLMLLLHHNFGIIYSAAYFQLLLTLCAIDTVTLPGGVFKTASSALDAFIKKNYLNLALILVGVLVHYLLFRNTDVRSDFSLLSLKLGFLRITTISFYWYVVVVLGLSFMLLLKLRAKIPGNYLAAGFCLIYLAIGNSLYFFGRSHENALIVLSAILLPLFFLLLDLVGLSFRLYPRKSASPPTHQNLAVIASLVFIVLTTILYSDNITRKATIQAQNAGKGQFIYPSSVSEQELMSVIAGIKTVSGNSPKVYFVEDNHFLLNYYGNYAPVGYYSPVYAWISKRAFNKFLQGLLDQGYYLVIYETLVGDMPASIKRFNYKVIGERLVIWK